MFTSRQPFLQRALPAVRTSRIPIKSRPFQRSFTSTNTNLQTKPASQPSPHGNFYRSHGRALFKSLTLAFFSYQVFYWAWITLEAETTKDEKRKIITGLEEEVRLLASGKGSHVLKTREGEGSGKRLLEEEKT